VNRIDYPRARPRGPTDGRYVTAREMHDVARASMDGLRGSPAAYLDDEVPAAPREPA
jgi:hypothetical protein